MAPKDVLNEQFQIGPRRRIGTETNYLKLIPVSFVLKRLFCRKWPEFSIPEPATTQDLSQSHAKLIAELAKGPGNKVIEHQGLDDTSGNNAPERWERGPTLLL
jgi:hypothetical protein